MIAIDTNLLVYAHRRDSRWHDAAEALVRNLAEGRSAWAIPWPCLHEFLAIVTHPKVFNPPSKRSQALAQVDAWVNSPTATLLTETDDHWPVLKSLVSSGRVDGPVMHDARIAAMCIAHGITELLSADRDFGRFVPLRVRNPLAGS